MQNKIPVAENTNLQSSMHKSFNKKWTGSLIVPFLMQNSQSEINIIFWLCNPLRGKGTFYHSTLANAGQLVLQ